MSQVVDEIDRGVRHEDDRVELKRIPKATPVENARRIAGHANQARDGRILWIFGLDEDGTRHALPEDLSDFNTWWGPVAACFDDVAPSPVVINIDGLLGIGFDTERLPFVIKHPGDGGPTREVPWREGTHVRSASRFDLLRLLVPIAERPEFALLEANLNVVRRDPTGRVESATAEFQIDFAASVYAQTTVGFVLPDHLLAVEVNIPGIGAVDVPTTATDGIYRSLLPRATYPTAELARLALRGDGQLVVSGPTPFRLFGQLGAENSGQKVRKRKNASLAVHLGLAGGPVVSLSAEMVPAPPRKPDGRSGAYDDVPEAGWRLK